MAPTGGAVQLPGALLSIKPANLCRPPPSAAAPPASGDSVECALRDALVDSLGPDVVEQVKRRTSCARCCEPCEGKCRVPHPPHLQVTTSPLSDMYFKAKATPVLPLQRHIPRARAGTSCECLAWTLPGRLRQLLRPRRSLLRLLVSSLRRALHPTQRQARRPQRQGGTEWAAVVLRGRAHADGAGRARPAEGTQGPPQRQVGPRPPAAAG